MRRKGLRHSLFNLSNGSKIEICIDESSGDEHPRNDMDNLTKIIYGPKLMKMISTTLEESEMFPDEDTLYDRALELYHRHDVVIQPISLTKSSAYMLYLSPFDLEQIKLARVWETRIVGFIYLEAGTYAEAYGKPMEKKAAYDLLKADIKYFDAWLNGYIYEWVHWDKTVRCEHCGCTPKPEFIESRTYFDDVDDAISDAKDHIKSNGLTIESEE